MTAHSQFARKQTANPRQVCAGFALRVISVPIACHFFRIRNGKAPRHAQLDGRYRASSSACRAFFGKFFGGFLSGVPNACRTRADFFPTESKATSLLLKRPRPDFLRARPGLSHFGLELRSSFIKPAAHGFFPSAAQRVFSCGRALLVFYGECPLRRGRLFCCAKGKGPTNSQTEVATQSGGNNDEPNGSSPPLQEDARPLIRRRMVSSTTKAATRASARFFHAAQASVHAVDELTRL